MAQQRNGPIGRRMKRLGLELHILQHTPLPIGRLAETACQQHGGPELRVPTKLGFPTDSLCPPSESPRVSLMNTDKPLSKVQFLKIFGKRVRTSDSQGIPAIE